MTYDDFVFPKAKTYHPDKVKNSCIIEHKLDGESLILAKGVAVGRRVSVVSNRRENKWDLMPDYIQALAKDFPVHGELWVEDGRASDVKTAIKHYHYLRQVCVEKTIKASDIIDPVFADKLRFTAYRCVGQDAWEPVVHRSHLIMNGFTVPELLCDQHRPPILPTVDELNKLSSELGIEGFMIKELTPENIWWKFKREDTIDLIITGVKDGEGKYLGLIGALLCSVFSQDGRLVEVASVGGMTDEERQQMTDDEDRRVLVGRVVEVKFQEWAVHGRLRHPRFVRFRDDKNPMECIMQF